MKFLVTFKSRVGAPAAENPLVVYQAAKEYLDALLADGILDCAYQLIDEGGMAIANADSHEEMWGMLTDYPLSPFIEFQVRALVDLDFTFDKIFERINKMMGE